MEPISPLDGDQEKQSSSTSFAVPSMSKDGSLRGWAVVAGSWLASELKPKSLPDHVRVRKSAEYQCFVLSATPTVGVSFKWVAFSHLVIPSSLTSRHITNPMAILTKALRPYLGSDPSSYSFNSQ